VFENKLLRRIVGSKSGEVTGAVCFALVTKYYWGAPVKKDEMG
jgi:hypothetical protein